MKQGAGGSCDSPQGGAMSIRILQCKYLQDDQLPQDPQAPNVNEKVSHEFLSHNPGRSKPEIFLLE